MKMSHAAALFLTFLGALQASSVTLTPGSLLVQQINTSSLTTANIETLTKTGSLAATSQITTTKDIAENLTVLNGSLYVSDGAGYVNSVNLAAGSTTPLFYTGTFGLNGIGSVGGNLLTLNYGASTVGEYSTSGALIGTITLASHPATLSWNGVASDGTTLYLADYPSGKLYEYSLTGALLGTISTGATGLSGVSYDASNNSLWISDTGNNQVDDFSTSGTLLSQFSLGGFRPGSGIAVVPGGVVSATPEPGYQTLILMSLALVGLGRLRQSKLL